MENAAAIKGRGLCGSCTGIVRADSIGRKLSRLTRRFTGRLLAPMLIVATLLPSAAVAAETATDGNWLPMRQSMAAPSGFKDVCLRYDWACARGQRQGPTTVDALKLAKMANNQINRAIRQITDRNQYQTEDFWSLPTALGGDCEDFVLLKKKTLIGQGIPAGQLLMATVLDRQRSPHAVLILRTDEGDFVLDNLRNQIKRWRDTGYTFLRMQDPQSPGQWHAVFAGGAFS